MAMLDASDRVLSVSSRGTLILVEGHCHHQVVIESRGFCIEQKCRSSVLVRTADEDEFMPRSQSVVAWGLLVEITRKRLKSAPHTRPFFGSSLLGYIWMVLPAYSQGEVKRTQSVGLDVESF
jgi:hypothetical protein